MTILASTLPAWHTATFQTSRHSCGRGMRLWQRRLLILWCAACCGVVATAGEQAPSPAAAAGPRGAPSPVVEGSHAPDVLPGTRPLTMQGDIASALVQAADAFLLDQTEQSMGRRRRHWNRDTSSPENYRKSVRGNRQRFRDIIGARDDRVAFDDLELLATWSGPALVGQSGAFRVYAVRWPVLDGVWSEGLLLEPSSRQVVANVVAVPDAEQTPEMICGLTPGVPAASQFARRLAESGCRVLVPAIIDRGHELSLAEGNKRQTRVTHRELLYRPAFEMGRHVIGYEVQKILAAVDWFATRPKPRRVGVLGYGEGGLLAMYAAAIDPRVDAAGVSGYFDSRQQLWQEPLDRNVFGLLDEFGDAEIASLIAPRLLVVEACAVPAVTIPPDTGGGPGRTRTPPLQRVEQEIARARDLVAGLGAEAGLQLVASADGSGPFGTEAWLARFGNGLREEFRLAASGDGPQHLRTDFDPRPRVARLYRQMNACTQRLLVESPYTRAQFLSRVDTRNRDLEAFTKDIEWYRDYFRTEVIGDFSGPLVDPKPRSRKIIDTERTAGYEVVLDVLPGLFAYGILQIPKNIGPGESRPAVVCQHGLEGRPQHVIGPDQAQYYEAFATKLAERGFVTFAPQHLYIFQDRFRTLQRKANPIKKTLFSLMVPQHRQLVRWLGGLDEVDPDRIAFYGLSYGGKSAMRIPPLVESYCAVICAGDFNEWVWKNVSDRDPVSYYGKGEYEIFEWDLGSTFNYAEMAALICPRPFMVERGHYDGVSHDEYVAFEYAKVRRMYADLKIPDRTEIEFFYGPHKIHGRGTFDFLHRHLHWPHVPTD